MKKRLGAAAAVGLAAIAGSASGQETCDIKNSVDARPRGAIFREQMFCGDADPVVILGCKTGVGAIDATLPVAPFDSRKGAKHRVTFNIGGKSIVRELTVSAPPENGPDANASVIRLRKTDPLWKALSRPGADIGADNGSYTTNVGLSRSAATHLALFRKICGL